MILSNGEVLMAWPVADHRITAGWLYSDGKDHHALDFGVNNVPFGTALKGKVVRSYTWNGKKTSGDTNSYGNFIDIEHEPYKGMTLKTRYAHLSKINVSVGQTVEEGEICGVTGSTGNVTGPHLHFEVILNGVRVNPLNWFDSDFYKAYDYVQLGDYKSVERVDDSVYQVLIDVSKHQGDIDWAKVPYKAIIRVGYRGYGSGKCVSDEMFENNISGAITAGKLFGFYWFSQAMNAEEGKKEAEFANSLINGRGNGLPLFIDCEWSNPSHNGRADSISESKRTEAAKAFCERARELGYNPGIYTFTTFAQSYIDYETLANKYIGWLADTRSDYNKTLPRNIHQYGQGTVSGISGEVDMNRVVNPITDEEVKPVNQLQRICIIGASDTIKQKAQSLGLATQDVTATIFDPASSGDAMTLWGMAESEDSPYFSSYTEV